MNYWRGIFAEARRVDVAKKRARRADSDISACVTLRVSRYVRVAVAAREADVYTFIASPPRRAERARRAIIVSLRASAAFRLLFCPAEHYFHDLFPR